MEFFFLVSGCLLYRGINPENHTTNFISETKNVFTKKYLYLIKYHIVGSLFCFSVYILRDNYTLKRTVVEFFRALPNLFLFQMTGLVQNDLNSIDWYLSVLCITLLIIYPFLLKHYYLFTDISGPLIALFILGYLCRQDDSLAGVEVWNGIFYKGFLRGFAEILLGGGML